MKPRHPSRDGPRINGHITAPKVRLIDADEEMLGVVSLAEALEKAEDFGLDLVEISPNAEPPVCQILDFGKFRYKQQKKRHEARKKQKTVAVKEIKLRPGIEEHDYQVKFRNAERFLKDENKVKVTLRFRGREMAHQDLGLKVLERFHQELGDLAKVEQMPKMEGRQMIMILTAHK